MRGLLHHEVLPRLAARSGGRVIRSHILRTTGVPESTLAEAIGDLEPEIAPLTLAYLPSSTGVDLRLTAWGVPPVEADARLASTAEILRARAGKWIYAEGETDLAKVLLDGARERGLRLVTAESCTGGLVGARITSIPGSSDVYIGGIIAYDNAAKVSHLGVSPELLQRHGAVSEPVARAMVQGVTARLHAELGIAVTGIAGPGGGTDEKPVGLVFIATAKGGDIRSHRHIFPGDRGEIQARAAQMALTHLRNHLNHAPV